MVYWIRRFARILGFTTFFSIMIIHFSGTDPLNYLSLISAFFMALFGSSLIWFAGFIIGDIFFKGVLTDIEINRSNLIEGGMIQQIQMKKEKNLPGGEDMPYTNTNTNKKRSSKEKNNHSAQ